MTIVIPALFATVAVSSVAVAQTKSGIAAEVQAVYGRSEALYLDLHQHPELSFRETETAAKLANELKQLGYEVTTGVGRVGIVGVLKNGAGPTVMLRTELDALPVTKTPDFHLRARCEPRTTPARTLASCTHAVTTFTWRRGWEPRGSWPAIADNGAARSCSSVNPQRKSYLGHRRSSRPARAHARRPGAAMSRLQAGVA